MNHKVTDDASIVNCLLQTWQKEQWVTVQKHLGLGLVSVTII